jgi:hypothetical protein
MKINRKLATVAIAAASLLLAGIPSGNSLAYQLTSSAWVPSGQAGWDGRWDGTFPTSRTLTNTLPSGTDVTIGVSGSVTNASRYWDDSGFMRLDDHGGQVTDYVSGTTVNTPAVAISNFCGSGSTGAASYDCDINALNADRGTLTFSFSRPVKNPIINLSGIGGYDWRWQGGTSANPTFENYMRLWTEFELLTPNATLQLLSTNGVFQLDGAKKKLSPIDPAKVSSFCHWNPNWDAGCVSAQINGTGSEFTFSLDYNSVGGVTGVNGLTNRTTDDTFIVSVSIQDDFGSAPASYDSSATSHSVGDLQIGAGVTADAIALLNPSSDLLGDSEDSTNFKAFPVEIPTFGAPGQNFTITFPVTGSSDSKVCGWVDWNLDGTFEIGERQCADVASGTSVEKTLTWVIPAGVTESPTWLRLRASYDKVGVELPNGKLDSGEIEDYNVTFEAASNGGTAELPVDEPENGEPKTLAETGGPAPGPLVMGGLFLVLLGLGRVASQLDKKTRPNKH